MTEMDGFDLKLLAELQADASATNQAIGERIGLSASQVSRRRQRLEAEKVIRRYRADLDPAALGLTVTAFIGVALATHSPQNASRFRALVKAIPAVQEAHTMTGDMDYLLKVVVKDLKALGALINDDLLPHDSVRNVRSFIAMETLKDDCLLPLD
ncbi:Lrp/AsnC family transcriptional regulator [Stappia sp. F7233]|uniref:Lrp/AsnC family transcriptional regulator n=1 Tax=Stappia albiluteola TaxID=2758565 RepID=A0A839AEU2_9HYPH|nr:Lrp/AsnC family transcriptional regulator [Stappia albiluteola]MBA5777412.1 Lrp/AsnC family transcriptional regulator [Stappia albiluteola]